jgi:hypothetical protein
MPTPSSGLPGDDADIRTCAVTSDTSTSASTVVRGGLLLLRLLSRGRDRC